MSRARARTRARLARWGQRAVDPPSEGFATGLERRLLGGAGLAAGATLLALPSRHRSWLPVVAVGTAAVATAVLAGSLLGAFGRGGSDVLQLAAAVDTTVVMPGGHAVAGRTGLNLPNGSVVWTGPNGSAWAGTVELGPGIEAVVDSGRLRLSPLGVGSSALGAAPAIVPVATPTTASAVPALSPPLVSRPPVTAPHSPPSTVPVTLPVTTTAPRHVPPPPPPRSR